MPMDTFLNPTFIISILVALSVHEWAHGFTAHLLGDPTAEAHGRLTLNPLAHLDPMGTIMFLLVGFGWARPVPVDPTFFRHPKRDMALTALAGPLSNLILAIGAFIGITLLSSSRIPGSPMGLLAIENGTSVLTIFLLQVFGSSLFVNLALMAFNLLPIAPLDGSKILHMFIPLRYERTYLELMERGPMLLLILILGGMFLGLPILTMWVFGIIEPILHVMLLLAS